MRLLVIRNSAMGDVAMLTPVLRGLINKYPEVELSLMTKEQYHPFFNNIDRLEFVPTDLKGKHKGLAGLHRLHKEVVKAHKIDCVIDLHDVLRSKILRASFAAKGIPVYVINKGRSEKKQLTNGAEKIQLKHTIDRYCDVFAEAGFPLEPITGPSIIVSDIANKKANQLLGKENVLNIGIAPFAKHALKVWPKENMIQLMNLIAQKTPCHFYLLGDANEAVLLDEFKEKVTGCTNMAGKYSLEEELAIISKLHFVISMDSSNMHMATLTGTKVISIWGATDPLTGFGAWMQPDEYAIRISVNELNCRPCTVYGKGECKRKDFACMNQLSAQQVFEQIEKTQLFTLQ